MAGAGVIYRRQFHNSYVADIIQKVDHVCKMYVVDSSIPGKSQHFCRHVIGCLYSDGVERRKKIKATKSVAISSLTIILIAASLVICLETIIVFNDLVSATPIGVARYISELCDLPAIVRIKLQIRYTVTTVAEGCVIGVQRTPKFH